jgi:hypothetical protein
MTRDQRYPPVEAYSAMKMSIVEVAPPQHMWLEIEPPPKFVVP